MNESYLFVLAAAAIAAAIYAQMRIPRFTRSGSAATLTRGTLLVLGIAVGYVMADTMGDAGGPRFLVFLIGLGAVHVPAAFILFFKRASGAGKS